MCRSSGRCSPSLRESSRPGQRNGEQGKKRKKGRGGQDVGPQGEMERARKRETQVFSRRTRPLALSQRAFMRPGRCLSQHSSSKFHRGLWTGWQRAAAAARKSFIQLKHTQMHTHTHKHTHTWKDAALLTDAHCLNTPIFQREN